MPHCKYLLSEKVSGSWKKTLFLLGFEPWSPCLTGRPCQLMLLWFHGSRVFGSKVLCDSKVLWFHGSVNGSMAPWFCGSMVPGFFGSKVLWFQGSMVLWFKGFVVPWFYGSRILWFQGSGVTSPLLMPEPSPPE